MIPNLAEVYSESVRAVRGAWDVAIAPLLPPSLEPLARYAVAGLALIVAGALTLRNAVNDNENEGLHMASNANVSRETPIDLSGLPPAMLSRVALLCGAWHGGQDDPLYAVSCAQGHREHWQRLDREILYAASAIASRCHTERKARGGKGVRADLADLSYLETALGRIAACYPPTSEEQAEAEEAAKRSPCCNAPIVTILLRTHHLGAPDSEIQSCDKCARPIR